MGLYKNIVLFFSFKEIINIEEKINCTLEIISIRQEKEKTDRYIVKVKKINSKLNNKKVYLYIKNEKLYHPGDIIKINGSFEIPESARNLYGFNYRNYLKQYKIYGIIFAEKIEYVSSKKDTYYYIGKIQESVKEKIEKMYSKDNSKFLEKVLFGFNTLIKEEVEENFENAGISHVLAISGLHITYVCILIRFALELCIKDYKIQNLFLILFLMFFLILTGGTPSCVRACITNIMLQISKITYRKNNLLKCMFVSFCVSIFLNIYFIFNIGLWLSYLGTTGIILYNDFINKLLKTRKYKYLNKIIDIISTCISAQVLIFPIMILCFNKISFSFFITNILTNLLLGPIIFLGYLSIISSYILLETGQITSFIEEKIIFSLFSITNFCSKLPFSEIYVKRYPKFFYIIYYISFIFISYKFFKKKSFFIKELKRKSNKLAVLEFRKKVFIFIIILVIFLCNNFKCFYKNEIEVYFVDVGQGDCTIIKSPKNNVIIDGGEGETGKYNYGKNVVLRHLLNLGIKNIDYIVISHFDSDHVRTV